jgi:hypothetical protein
MDRFRRDVNPTQSHLRHSRRLTTKCNGYAKAMQRRCRMDFAFKFGNNRRANCSREDSNLHGLPHTVLSRTRLPIPPRELENGPLKLLCQFVRASRKTRCRSWQRKNSSSLLNGCSVTLLNRAAVSAPLLQAVALCALCLTSAANRHNSRRQFRNLPAVDRSLLPSS